MPTTIEILNPVFSRINRSSVHHIASAMSFENQYWTRNQYSRTRHVYQKDVFVRKEAEWFYFLTGHVPRLLRILEKKGEKVSVKEPVKIPITANPQIPGIKLRED